MTTDVTNIPTSTSNSDDLSEQRFGGEAELRELVCQSLENDGILSRLKAELRAAVFKTIERATTPASTRSHPPAYDSTAGRVSRALVLDWLAHSRLLYTEDVLKVETTGPNHPAPLTHAELLEQLHIKPNQGQSQPLLHALINQSKNTEKQTPSTINSLPDHIERSIDSQFPAEKINDLNQLREHFRSLFAHAFDPSVLDAFVNKNIPSNATSFSKRDYEELCLKWIQACSKALTITAPPQTVSTGAISSLVTTHVLAPRNTINAGQRVTQAARSMSPAKESKSTSSSSSSSPTSSLSEEKRKPSFDFPLPTTQDSSKSVIKKVTDIIPPSLINFGGSGNNDEEDEDEDTSASILSKRNATPAALNRLNNIYNIDQGDQTPRTRTTLQKAADYGARNLPVEYDDESISQSVSHSIISSVDDITVDKASTNAANIDFIEDF